MQDIDIPQNRVIIIGGDHHNGLGLARIFGLNGKKVSAIIISNKKRSWMATSKFIEFHKIFKTEKEAFDYILENYSAEPLKPVLIPYSDGAAMELDIRLNQFKDCFYVPSINGEQGRIASLMDKDAQYKWALDHGIKMAESAVVELNKNYDDKIDELSYPVILKPAVSALGDKRDIVICENQADCFKFFSDLKNKGYRSIFCQKFLKIDYEIVIVGFIGENRKKSFVAHRVIRRWPENGGTNSFSSLITEKDVLLQCEKILDVVAKYGYQGTIDVEAFVVDGDIWLNEINWRNSGGVFRTLNNGFFYAFSYFLDLFDVPVFMQEFDADRKTYSMVEYTDVRHVFMGKISLFHFLKDFCRCENFALFSSKDVKPFVFKFFYVCRK